MPMDTLRRFVSRRPVTIIVAWLALAAGVVLTAPDLTRLAAEGQAHLLPDDAEASVAAEYIKTAWPDQWSDSMAVVLVERNGGLTDADHAYVRRLADRFARDTRRPKTLLRVLGPASQKEIAERLVSKDGTASLIVLPFSTSFVAPITTDSLSALQRIAADNPPPPGATISWTGDAVIGRDYMADVQRSLDRAALATVVLLLIVLLAVYRSLILALVPLLTIGVGLAISRGVLAWMTLAGWPISPLVELFLVVILFGCGTDFCLFLSWRFGEHWSAANPGWAMRATLRRVLGPLLTSAGTVMAGLLLMGTNRFRLFSSTGPSVALGLLITLTATLTLAPALLILLARHRPKAFAGLTSPSSGFWDDVAHVVFKRPFVTWLCTLALMVAPAALGFNLGFLQDLFSELPQDTPSVRGINRLMTKFGQGMAAPLSVVLKTDGDFHTSEGLALIDDVSRLLNHQRSLGEIRSATQPLGSPRPLERARLASRLREIDEGFGKIAEGAGRLESGLNQGAAKLRTAMLLQDMTGLPLTGSVAMPPESGTSRESVNSGLAQVSAALLGVRIPANLGGTEPAKPATKAATKKASGPDPRDQMLRELGVAAAGAGQILEGARRARHEIESILNDPVGRNALDRLLITQENVRQNPDLKRSFDVYISPDGRLTRLDLAQNERIFSDRALDHVQTLRRRIREYLGEAHEVRAAAAFGGANAGAADVRALTRADQVRTWIIVPLGVFIILVIALRDIFACLNLVLTMVLTYAFALGVTHLVFVNALGAPGLDWKVPYFLFVLLVAVGVDYNVFLMARLQEESEALGLRAGIMRAVAQTGGLITSAALITAGSFAALMFSPLSSLRQLGLALVVGILIDAVLVRPVLVPCGQWLMYRRRERKKASPITSAPPVGVLVHAAD